jgi:predicted amidophosphoribosyltransferase
VPCDPFLLARVKRTASQVGLSKAQRQDNLQGLFACPSRRGRA